jgi:uncharacterized protein YfaS (alpha-2-macroglobulin family)
MNTPRTRRLRCASAVLLAALLVAALPAPGAAGAPAARPAGASGTVIVPDRFLRRWDPLTVFFEGDAGPAGGGAEDHPERVVSLVPDQPGAWSWLDARTLQFRPADPWPPLARFRVTAGAAVAEVDTLMSPPQESVPRNGSDSLPPVSEVTLTFPEPLDAAALARMLSVELRPLPGAGTVEREPLAPGDFSVREIERATRGAPARYAVRFREPVPYGRRAVLGFRLSLGDAAEAFAEVAFSTAEPFRARLAGPVGVPGYPITAAGSRYPRDQAIAGPAGGREVAVYFNAAPREIGPVEARNLMRFTPPVDGVEYRVEGEALIARGAFERETLYRLDLAPTQLADARGRPLEMRGESTLYFHFRRPSPDLRWGAGQGIVERLGPQMVPLEGRGTERVDLRIHRVDPLDRSFWPLPGPVTVDESRRPPGPGEEPQPFTEPGREASQQEIAARIAALGSPAVSAIVTLPLRREGGDATFGIDVAPHLAFIAGKGRPGHYLVGIRRLDGSSTRSWMRLQVTDLALTAVEEPRAVRFLVTALSSGAPVPGALVRVEGEYRHEGGPGSWRVLAQGTTDADGAFRWPAPGPSARDAVTVRRISVEKERDLLVLDPGRPPERYADGLWQPSQEPWLQWAFQQVAGRGPQAETLCHIFTERPLYRPEEEVFIKGYVRRREKGRLAVVPMTGAVVVRGPGDLEWRYPATLTAAGSFTQRFAQEKLPTGEYAARFEGPKGQTLAEVPFRMEAYRLPLFEVRLHGPDRIALDRDSTIGLAAAYFAGGAVAGRPVQWRVTQFPYAWTPARRPGFFYSSDGRFSKTGKFESTPTLTRQDATDASGAASIALNPAVEPTAQPRQYVVEATVTGADDQTVTSTTRVLALPPFVLGLKVPRYQEQAARLDPEVIAVGPDGAPVADLPVTVRLLRRQWHSVLRAGDFSDGVAKYQTDVVDEKIAEATVRTAADPVAARFALPGAGVYVVEVEARDRLDRAQVVAVDLYAGGAGPIAWAKPIAGVFTAAPDRKEYAPGETATVVLASPFQNARALAIVEAPEGNEYRWVEVRGGAAAFQLPILASWVPRVPVHFILERGRIDGTAPLPGTGTDLGRPTTVAATAWLAVKPVENRVEVALEHPERAQPGDTVRVRIRLADPRGKPLPGEVTLWLVDQAVLGLAKEQRLDPLPDFITEVASHLAVRDTRNLVFGFLPFAERPGGEAAAKEALDLLDRTTVRKNFRTVPYFNPAIAVGPDGVAEVAVQLPDNLTNFKMRAKAVSGAERFGFAASQIAVRLPVIVQPALPRFVRPGDGFAAAVVGRVVEGPGGPGTAQMKVEGAELRAAGRAELLLAPNRPERIEFPVLVPTPAYAPDGRLARTEVVVRAALERTADGARDAFELRLPIRDDRERVRLRSILELAPGTAAPIPALPEAARPGTVRRRLLVSDQPALVKMAAGLDFLLAYPYGCTEQRLSAARAHIAMKAFREALRLQDAGPAADQAVRMALEWLPGVVDEGGLASYWPGGTGYVSLTAWAVRFLVEARAAGYPVDGKLLERMTRALEQALRSDYGRFVDGEAFTERCLALGALAAAGRFNAAYAAELARQAQFLGMEGSAEVLLAFAGAGAGGSAPPGTVGGLAKKLADGVTTRLRQGTEVYAGLREDWSGRNPLILPDEAATVAVMAQALARANAEPARRALLVEALVTLGKGDGWGSTRANAAALLGLAQFLTPPFAGSRPRAVDVRFGGEAATVATSAGAPVGILVNAEAGAGEAVLRPAEAGAVVLRADTEYVPLADGSRVAPQAGGFAVARELLLVRADGAPPERMPLDEPGREIALTVGDVVEERVRVTNPEERHFVAVVVPLAAGMEPLNPNLATAPPEAKPAAALTLAPTYAAYLDDQAAFYYDTLPKGTYEFAFRTRATVAGVFVQPPAKAELMYDGAVRGNGAGARIAIAPKERAPGF